MKSSKSITLAALALLAAPLSAAGPNADQPPSAADAAGAGKQAAADPSGAGDQPAPPALETPKEKLSYAWGVSVGRSITTRGIDVDPALVVQGIWDGLSGEKLLLSEEGIREGLEMLNAEARKQAVERMAGQAAADSKLARIKIVYQLDSRLTTGLYMGERWVSPPAYTRVGDGKTKEVAIETRIEGIDAKGRPAAISPEWAAAEPEMVTVEPSKAPKAKAGQFTITVRRAGESSLRLSAGEITKELVVKAAEKGGTLQVDISPKVKSPKP